MSIQKTQPSFTGKIESLKRINTQERVFKPLTQEENKLLRPLINYLKHHCEGIHSIQVQDNPSAISLYSEYTPKYRIENSDSFVRVSSRIGNKFNQNDVQHLLKDARETTTYFKEIRAREKALFPSEPKPQKKESFFSRVFSLFN